MTDLVGGRNYRDSTVKTSDGIFDRQRQVNISFFIVKKDNPRMGSGVSGPFTYSTINFDHTSKFPDREFKGLTIQSVREKLTLPHKHHKDGKIDEEFEPLLDQGVDVEVEDVSSPTINSAVLDGKFSLVDIVAEDIGNFKRTQITRSKALEVCRQIFTVYERNQQVSASA